MAVDYRGMLFAFGGTDRSGAMAALEGIQLRCAGAAEPALTWLDDDDMGVTGCAPCARMGHSATLVGGYLCVAGGSTASSNYKPGGDGQELQSVFLLDMRAAVRVL